MFKPRYMVMAAAMAVAALMMIAGQGRAAPAGEGKASDERQQKLIDVLRSNAPAAEKAITCKRLAVYGTKDAVPALAAWLVDKELSSWARIALEAIPDPAAGDALREAMGKVEGRLLIGVINSIGYRRDGKAVAGLVVRLRDGDAEVASAAAAALGRVGGEQAGKVLEQSLAAAPVAVRPAVAEGCILCAERFLADGNRGEAIKLYDAVRKSEVPKQRVLDAVRGAILSRGSAGMPLLMEQLRSPEKGRFEMGLRVAREMAGGEVTEAVVAELGKAEPDRRALLLLVLGDRGDAKALPAVLEAVQSGPVNVRIAAARVLEQLGDTSCVPALLEAAAGSEAEPAEAAKVSLARMSAKGVDAELMARLQQSSGKSRQVLIELVEQRRIDGAIQMFVGYAEDADAGVRSAALVAIGAIGEGKQAADLVRLLQKAQDAKDRGDIEKALMALSSRWGEACVGHLLPLARSDDSGTRMVALRGLSCCGGPEALAAVKSAVDDKDEAVQNEAVRTLSTWPNRWPDDAGVTEPLLSLAKSGKKAQHQVLALRGYLQYVQGAKKLKGDEKLAKVNEILPLVTRAAEKRQAVSVLGEIRTGGSLQALVALAGDGAVAEEACAAIVDLAGRTMQGVSKEERQKALGTVVEKSKNDATKKKAEEALKGIR